MTIGIYKIVNTRNNKCYIGQSIHIEKRFTEHLKRLENNKHHSIKLQNSYNKIKDKSVFQFEIVEETTKERLSEREEYYIEHFDSFYNGYNCSLDVDGSKYTNKMLKNKKRNTEYKKFMDLYDKYKDSIVLGDIFFERLIEKHYKLKTYRNMCNIIKWFISNYDPQMYNIKFEFYSNNYFLLVGDKETGGYFVCYGWKKGKVYNSVYDTKVYLDRYKENYSFSEDKHYIVG